jgi:uracil-DNA glycosylase family 4
MVVSDVPSRNAYSKGRLLSESAGKVLKEGLRSAEFDIGDFYVVPQIRCPFDADSYDTKQKRDIQLHCREHLLDDLHEFKPEVIIPLGAEATRQVVNRAIKITKVRGVAEQSAEHGCTVLPLLSPSMVSMYPQHMPVFKADCETLGRLIDHEYDSQAASDAILGDYEIVEDLEFLIEQNPKLVVFDLETTGLEFFHTGPDDAREYDPAIHGKDFDPSAAILTMQFCIRPGEAYMLVWDHPEAPIPMRRKRKLINQIARLLCRPGVKVVGQNLKYDCNYLKEQTGIRFKIGGDTLMMAALLDENMISKNQDILVKHYVPEMAGYADHFNATVDKSRMWEVPLPKLLNYGCGDVDSCYRLYKRMLKEVKADEKLFKHYTYVSLPGLNTFAGVEQYGLGVDYEALASFEALMEESVAEQNVSLMSQVPKSIKRKHVDAGLKFSRADFIRDILFYHKDGFRLKAKVFTKSTAKLSADRRVPSTSSKDHLPYFYDDCPFTMELSQYVKDSRLLGTNIKGFQKKYIHDGLVRPTYSLTTTVTGRSSCVKDDTPINTLRGIIRADAIVEGDYVFTHKGRWRKVVELFRKVPTMMYSLYLSNKKILTVTGEHRILLNSGEWRTVHSLLEIGEGNALAMQSPSKGSRTYSQSGEHLPNAATNNTGSSGPSRSQSPNGAGNDRTLPITGGVQGTQEYPIPQEQTGREEPAVRARVGVRLRGWTRLSNPLSEREEVLRTSDSLCGVPRDSCGAATGESGSSSHRREAEEQYPGQPSGIDGGWAPEDTRTVPDAGGGLAIEKVICAGVHRVYDFQVEEDHSYLACGVFNHNSENPNGQNFPKRGKNAKAYRRIFVPPPGYYVLEADLSQAELRIAADMANDRAMLEIYRTGGDIHTATACIALNKTMAQFKLLPKAEQKDWRTKAKAINFGFLYGMGWRKFIGYAKTQYGVVFTEEEAQYIRDAFFDRYSALPAWHASMREFAHKHGYVRSYSGRIRHLPMIDSEEQGVQSEAERQAINSPVQEFASSLGVMAMGRLSEEIDPQYLAPIAFVHDAIYCYVPYKYADWGARTLKRYMQTNPLKEWFNLHLKCPIIADVSIGLNLGDTYELEGFSLDEPYDFGKLWNAEENSGLLVPKQYVPPHEGRLLTPPYTTA